MSLGQTALEWIQANGVLLAWLGVISGLTFIGSLALVPILVARIPVDYFTHRHRVHNYALDRHPVLHRVAILLKNVLGYALVFTGIVMLVLPGQGILTILIGVMLIDFPGKYELEKRLVGRPAVMRSINWMRAKAKRQPLKPPWDGE